MPTKGSSSSLDTVIIFTSNFQALAAFYQHGLGLPAPEAFGQDHLGIEMEGVYLGFDRTEPSPDGQGAGISLWFAVSDLDQTYARLLRLGAIERYPPVVKPFGDRLASVYDPDGNVLGIVQR